MRYNLDEIVDRSESNAVKYDFMQLMFPNVGQNTIPLWIADMDFPCAQPIIEAIKKRADKRILGYSGHFTGEYFRSIANWMQRRFGWYLHSSDLIAGQGIVPTIKSLIKVLTEEGDGVIIQRPVYGPFTKNIETTNRTLVNNLLINNNGDYTIDFEDLENKLKDPKNKVLIFCSPHNPVGRVWTEDELLRVGNLCKENNVSIISDEIHCDITRKGVKHTPLDKLFPNNDFITTCFSVSKTFNLAGMHVSTIVMRNKEVREKWDKEVGLTLLNPLSIVAAQAAYDEGESWLNQVNEYIDNNLLFIKDFLSKNLPKAKYEVADGTYLAWVDFSAYDNNWESLSKRIIENAKVLPEEGHMFGEEGNNYTRINAACPRIILERALTNIVDELNKPVVGEKIEDFRFNTPWERDVSYLEYVEGKKNYLVFLRYYGCTICQVDLMMFSEAYNEFKERGIELSVVLQSDPEVIREQTTKKQIPYTIICDPNQELYKKYNIKPAQGMEELVSLKGLGKIQQAGQLGLTHGKYEGNELQLPAMFLIDENGAFSYIHYGKDAADILEIEEMLNLAGEVVLDECK